MKILAIGAHPDDIEYGCGGSLIKFYQRGDKIIQYLFTKGDLGGDAEIRHKEQVQAAKKINAEVYFGGYEDSHVPTSREAIANLEKVINEIEPDLILVNWPEDTHQDHRAVAEVTISATRYIKNVIFFEVPTSKGFEPNVFVDIGSVLREKIELLETHTSQVFNTRIASLSILESATSCANFRGFQGRVKYAEGFNALRLSPFCFLE